ncbi:MAG: aminotransferase class IV [Phycisphaerales bacterium]
MIVSLNNELVPAEQARVSVFDRGFLFGDGVYEALRTHRGRVLAVHRHIERLCGSLGEARIGGIDPGFLERASEALVAANGLTSAFVYWQITRGTPPVGAPRRSRVPSADTEPTVFGYAEPCEALSMDAVPHATSASVRPDTRWLRGHLKSISLLGGVLAAIESQERGHQDAILVRDGLVTEGPSTNVFLALNGRIVTPALDSAPMLAGVTRGLLLDADPSIVVRPVTESEVRGAEEIMLTGTRTTVAAVTRLDGAWVGGAESRSGAAGPAACGLLRTLVEAADRDVERRGAAGDERAGGGNSAGLSRTIGRRLPAGSRDPRC